MIEQQPARGYHLSAKYRNAPKFLHSPQSKSLASYNEIVCSCLIFMLDTIQIVHGEYLWCTTFDST